MIPMIPKMATVPSLSIAFGRLGHTAGKAVGAAGSAFFKLDPLNDRGIGANAIAEREFGHALTGLTLIQDHSQFHRMAAFLSPHSKHEWQNRILVGGQHSRGAAVQYRPRRTDGEWLRKCPVCVQEDKEKYGIAYWRVEHQLHNVHHCLNHGALLHSHCGYCNNRFSSQLPQSADDSCYHCGSLLTVSESVDLRSPYKSLLRTTRRILANEAPEVSPFNRAKLFAAMYCATGEPRIGKSWLDSVVASWGEDSLMDLDALFGANYGSSDTASYVRDGSLNCAQGLFCSADLLGALVCYVLDNLDYRTRKRALGSEHDEEFLHMIMTRVSGRQKVNWRAKSYFRYVFEYGYPVQDACQLVASNNKSRVFKFTQIPMIREFVLSMPDNVYEEFWQFNSASTAVRNEIDCARLSRSKL